MRTSRRRSVGKKQPTPIYFITNFFIISIWNFNEGASLEPTRISFIMLFFAVCFCLHFFSVYNFYKRVSLSILQKNKNPTKKKRTQTSNDKAKSKRNAGLWPVSLPLPLLSLGFASLRNAWKIMNAYLPCSALSYLRYVSFPRYVIIKWFDKMNEEQTQHKNPTRAVTLTE